MLDIELPAVEKPIIMSSVEAALNLANHEIEGLKLEASSEAFINKIQDLNHLRTHSVTTGVSSLEHAIHTAYISDRAAVGTPWKSNVHLTQGLENFNPTAGKMDFEAAALKQLDASIEAAESGFMGTIKKVIEWIKTLPSKLMDYFKSNKKRIEEIEGKLDNAGEGKIKLNAKQAAAFDLDQFANIKAVVMQFQTEYNVAFKSFDDFLKVVAGKIEQVNEEDKEKRDGSMMEMFPEIQQEFKKLGDSLAKILNYKSSSEQDISIAQLKIPSHQEIVVSEKSSIADANTYEEATAAVSSFKVSVRDKSGFTEKEIDALSKDDVSKLLSAAKELVDFPFDLMQDISDFESKVHTYTSKFTGATTGQLWKKFSATLIAQYFTIYTKIWNSVTQLAKGSLTEHLKVAEMSVAGKAPEAKEGE
tara:strand:- start:81461 stop:82714 length:1254 start_codon:yes stop_codon:yes gene_type:complete